MSSFAIQLRAIATQLLRAANTDAGTRVYPSRAAPVTAPEMPILLVYTPEFSGRSTGAAGQPRFSGIQTLVIEGRVAAIDEATCGDSLDALMDPVLDALLSDPRFTAMTDEDGHARLERVASIESKTTVLPTEQSGDRYIGRGVHIIGLQTHLTFRQRGGIPLAEITVTGDATNIFSPTGTFGDDANAGFPQAQVTPAPRTSGPDGRAEISFVIPFQTPSQS